MDQDKSLNISYDEWRDFLLLAPSSDLHDILKFWRHSTVCNPCFDSFFFVTLKEIMVCILRLHSKKLQIISNPERIDK